MKNGFTLIELLIVIALNGAKYEGKENKIEIAPDLHSQIVLVSNHDLA